MAMSLGSKGGVQAQINMTPMIDVLLVLIIIFMVITPIPPVGLTAKVPQVSQDSLPPTPANDIVITVQGDHTVLLNQELVMVADLEGRLTALFHNHSNHVLFMRGDKSIEFGHMAAIIDIARGVGLDRVALMTQ